MQQQEGIYKAQLNTSYAVINRPNLYLMLNKITLFYVTSLLSTTSSCIAQASFKCYTTPKTKAYWIIGIRTGVSREYDISHFQSELNSKNRSWTQQLFVQRSLGKHLMLELQTMHQSTWKDLIAYTPPTTGQTLNSVIKKSHRLHTNMILHYLLPTATDRIKAGIGAGLGFIISRSLLETTYTQSGESLLNTNITYPIGAPNLIIALTGSYLLKKNIAFSGQTSYSNLSIDGISHLNLNIGIQYTL